MYYSGVMVFLLFSIAHAGPVPSFPTNAPAMSLPASTTPVQIVVSTPEGSISVFVPRWIQRLPVAPEHPPATRALLPYVPAEPVKRQITTPGTLTPISELPSAFQPITPATNRLPVVSIREKAPAP